jgi:metal-responsive CopG/Arc/MetJ family transcriptional regulator|tara:strand:- start:338 stop:523 length:186 start_codon:yes stop_codon:yes gene_type:complete
MAKNMWQKERSGMLRDLIREYIEEGYEHRDAKKIATKEVDALMEDRVSFVDTLWEDTFDDC